MARGKAEIQAFVQPVSPVEELIELSHVEVYQPVKLLDGVRQCFDTSLGHKMMYDPRMLVVFISYTKGSDHHEVMIPVSNCAWMSRA